jgi:tetratricopeptide (TPR) repeat protein
MRNTKPELASAYELDQRGQLDEAIAAYRRLIAVEPENSDALHLLGVALARKSRLHEALELLCAAARLQPDNPYIQINLGNALSELKRDAEAVTALDRAVALKADLASAWHALGRAQLRLKDFAAAERSLAEASRLMPAHGSVHSDLAVALERLGRQEEALARFERATVLNPNLAEAHHNRGVLLAARGALPQALQSLDRAIELQPRLAALHANRGNVLADLGRTAEAVASYDRAIALDPRVASVLLSRGNLLLYEQPEKALASFNAALQVELDNFMAHAQRGVALALLERYAEALTSYERALALQPDSAQTHNGRGVALSNLARTEEAMESFRAALVCEPNNLQALTNGANTLALLHRHEEALQWFAQATALKPTDPELAWGKSRLLLSLGDFKQGWPLYEARLQLPHLRSLQRHSDLPRWMPGQPIAGRTLLVHAEQGLGDTLQFSRFVPLAEARGANVIFEVQPALKQLLGTLSLRGELRASGEKLPPFDLRSPLLSLPWLLDIDLAEIPAAVPYLSADPKRVASWRERLAALPGLKIGITWQGNPITEKQGGFGGRSFPLSQAAPLARLPHLTLISLQKGAGSEQRGQVDFAARVLELQDPWILGADEVLDTAALMSSLDLIVSSDTFTAHMAGALGLPVWVVLGTNADWRWLVDRENSPWYPSMRLFRQHSAGQWSEVFERIAGELEARRANMR